ncbi:KH domain protein [Candidatus Methanoperedens nitroreducens]|uniref:KH domain protein n=1 Tax=Candidatus Methanoperedens nitratireducens TaxID=1392998 RepID=A0A062UYK0_9EURY|nr:KH domain-containing protein [Candidatus Methanoperedens nitroreducens]KCZ71996.1 KH domain protein [Candidatus Methanoperedens nitroreducens]MDJ1422028.1 KH domain-containing protein [Candidatus Methanoperedens sp.]
MTEHIKIPLERVAVLVGPKGSVKELIENKSTATLNIDSQSGDVEITEAKDPIKGLRTREVINAIARGFSPEKALRLFDDDLLMFETIDLSNIARSEKDLQRIKGRIIGKAGKTREVFENLTSAQISVYGKTICLIGYPEQNAVARAGIEMLLEGSTHGPVYKFLEKKKSELKRVEMGF